ncbi:MAG: hypothetical protein AAGU27_09805 [Dehalobacterium sp.]
MNIILILIMVTLILVSLSVFGKSHHRRRHMGRNTAKWILVTYCAVLLTSVLVLNLIPNKDFLYPENYDPNQPVDAKYLARERVDIVQAAHENRLAETDGIYLLERRNFSFQGEELDVLVKGEFIPVIVKRRQQTDGQIEAAFYTTPTLCNNIDLSEKVLPPQMELSESTLMLTNPDNEIRIVDFKKDFTAAQFLKPASSLEYNSMHFEWGQKVLYLEIPSNVQVNSRQLYVQFVGE